MGAKRNQDQRFNRHSKNQSMPQILDGDLIFWVRSLTEPVPDALSMHGTERIEVKLLDLSSLACTMDLRSLVDFSLAVKRIQANENTAIVVVPEEINMITTAALLVGTSMIAVHGFRPDEVMEKFCSIAHSITAFDDITMEHLLQRSLSRKTAWLAQPGSP